MSKQKPAVCLETDPVQIYTLPERVEPQIGIPVESGTVERKKIMKLIVNEKHIRFEVAFTEEHRSFEHGIFDADLIREDHFPDFETAGEPAMQQANPGVRSRWKGEVSRKIDPMEHEALGFDEPVQGAIEQPGILGSIIYV